jgi:hypothetical protein
MTETFPKFSFLDLPCALSLNFEVFSTRIPLGPPNLKKCSKSGLNGCINKPIAIYCDMKAYEKLYLYFEPLDTVSEVFSIESTEPESF